MASTSRAPSTRWSSSTAKTSGPEVQSNGECLCTNLRDVASSLALLHSRRLLHRDVSAGNIRLTERGAGEAHRLRNPHELRQERHHRGDTLRRGAGNARGHGPRSSSRSVRARRDRLLRAHQAARLSRTRSVGPGLGVGTWPAARAVVDYVPGIPGELDELVLSSAQPGSIAPAFERRRGDRQARSHRRPCSRSGTIAIAQSYLRQPGADRARDKERRGSARGWSGRSPDAEARCSSRARRVMAGARSWPASRETQELRGATVLTVNARAYQHSFGVWQALVQRALTEVPERAAASRTGPRNDGRDAASV